MRWGVRYRGGFRRVFYVAATPEWEWNADAVRLDIAIAVAVAPVSSFIAPGICVDKKQTYLRVENGSVSSGIKLGKKCLKTVERRVSASVLPLSVIRENSFVSSIESKYISTTMHGI